MLMQIITRTPPWVLALFLGLLAVGLSQLRERTASLTRITILPVVMFTLATSGVLSVFGDSGVGMLALLVFAIGALLAGLWITFRQSSDGTRYDASQRQFTLPGSAWPLALIMGIFLTKYAVGASLGMHPELARNTAFALGVSGLYGVFSGVFAAWAVRLWRLALARADQQPLTA